MKKIDQNKNGFSMIELMTAITIVAIMTAVSLVSLKDARERKEVETAAREVAAAVREAQNYALTGKNIGTGSCEMYYLFWNFVPDGVLYRIYGLGGGCKSSNFSLKNGVQFQTIGRYAFKVPFSKIEFPSFSTDIILKKGNTCYKVTALVSGLVEETKIDCP